MTLQKKFIEKPKKKKQSKLFLLLLVLLKINTDEVVVSCLGAPPRKRNIFTCHAFIFPFSMSENVCHLGQDDVCGFY